MSLSDPATRDVDGGLEKRVNHLEHCDALEIEVERFATAMALVSGDVMVTTCPGWTVDDLALHLGGIHRWAEVLVRTRSATRLGRTPLTRNEVTPTPEWVRDGGRQLVDTLRQADPDEQMWAWGLDQHVRFWSRRQVHETLVHRMDLELASNVVPVAEPLVASDAVDEFLTNIEKVIRASPNPLLHGSGEQVVFRVKDADAVWSATLANDGFVLSRHAVSYEAEITGRATDLLLVICRRRPPSDPTVIVKGNEALVNFWLEHTSFG